MNRKLGYALTIALMVFLIPQARAQQPVIGDGGIVNGASFARVGLPNSAIAQGSIFAVFGTNMGPAQLVQVSSFPLPTSEGLAGTSISVTVGATTLNAIMLFTTANQVAAVLPSNTPVGTGTLTLTYNGLTSAPAPITVVQSSFGMFTLNQAGSGQAVIQNFNSQTDQPINLVSESVRPGQIITLWGTGLGPVEGDEAGQPLPGNLANLDIHVWILGREAQIQYRGRSGCCVGIDQIVLVIPEDVSGCYVPIYVLIGDVVSNFGTISISPSGGTCSDSFGLSGADIQAAQSQGSMKLGLINLSRVSFDFGIPGFSGLTQLDIGSGSFTDYNFNAFTNFLGGNTFFTLGACSVFTFSGEDAVASDPTTGMGLDAGAVINVNGPSGAKTLDLIGTGLYSGQLGGGFDPFGGAPPPYLEPGTYTISNGGGGSGANAVGPFQVNHTISVPVFWSNKSTVSPAVRAQGLEITWTGGTSGAFAFIFGTSLDLTTTAGAAFTCLADGSTGSFTVPAAVLLALPPSGIVQSIPTGFLGVGITSEPTPFEASGLDVGFITSSSIDQISVEYQ